MAQTDLRVAMPTTTTRAVSESHPRAQPHGGRRFPLMGPRESVIGGSEAVRGFVIRFRNGKRLRVGEVHLATWEGGTQVHVVIPAEHSPKDLATLTSWLRPALGLFGAAEQ
jgi:hypothetical protein